MKIVLSPSKTKKLMVQGQAIPTERHLAYDVITGGDESPCMEYEPHLNPSITASILELLQGLTPESLGKALKLKEEKAQALYTMYAHFDEYPVGVAGESYDGIAFKYLNWADLSHEARQAGVERLVIMSALYGVVEPLMGIRDYRLDMVDKIGVNLYDVWCDAVDAYFHKEDWILNLASKEYSKMVHHPRVVTVEFWELKGDVYKQMSTSSKMSRGMMARACLEQKVTQVCDLPREINGFTCHMDLTHVTIPSESFTIRYERK